MEDTKLLHCTRSSNEQGITSQVSYDSRSTPLLLLFQIQSPQSHPQLCSRKPTVVSLLSLTPSPMNHKNLPLQPSFPQFIPVSQLQTPGDIPFEHTRPGEKGPQKIIYQAILTHYTLLKSREDLETKGKILTQRRKKKNNRLSPLRYIIILIPDT